MGKLEPQIQSALESQIEDFLNSGEESYRFPSELFNYERQYIHSLCRKRGLQSKSFGSGASRRLTISFKETAKNAIIEHPSLIDDKNDHALNILKNYQEKQWLNNKKPKLGPKFRLEFHQKPSIPSKTSNRPSRTLEEFRSKLPIASKKEEIVNAIENSKVTIIVGETGSGKTTQVPQFLLEAAENEHQPTRIFFSQPRRLATITCASRIADERGSSLGKEIGYQIRLDNRVSPVTNCILCTHGVLLRTLIGSKQEHREQLGSMISHVILDEIHERDKHADFLLIELREMLKAGELKKLILMSATIDVKFFKNYFEKEGIQTEAVFVEGRTGEIVEKTLEDIFEEFDDIREPIEDQVRCRAREVQILEKLELDEVEEESKGASWGSSEINSNKGSRIGNMDRILAGISGQLSSPTFLPGVDSKRAYPLFKQLEKHFSVDPTYQRRKTVRGENALNLAVRAGCKDLVERYVNRDDDFMIIREKDKGGRDCIQWAANLCHKHPIMEQILEFLYDHDPGLEGEDDEEDPQNELTDLAERYEKLFPRNIDNALICKLVSHLWLEKDFSNTGSILVFMPGFAEIKSLGFDLMDFFKQKKLTPLYDDEGASNQNSKNLFFLHSQIPPRKQAEAFIVGKKKIILSTNIAETSVTIPDVDFIVDCGKQRMKSFEPGSSVSMWLNVLISKSSSRQRAGRCGRLPGTKGICYHLFSRKTYQLYMPDEQAPEITRIPIPELCLSAKMLGGNAHTIVEFLSKAPDPPAAITITSAVDELKALGAIESNEDLTPLGSLLVDMPLEPRLGKAVIASVLLRCVDPVVTIVTSLGYRDPFVITNNDYDKNLLKKFKTAMSGGCQSDHHLIVRSFTEWMSGRTPWKIERVMSIPTLQYIKDVRRQIFDHLRACNLHPNNENAQDWSMISAALSIGTFPNVGKLVNLGSNHAYKSKQVKVISANDTELFVVHSSSMHFQNRDLALEKHEWVIFNEMFQVARGAVPNLKTVTAIPILPIALFGGIERPVIRTEGAQVFLQWNHVNLTLKCPDHQIACKFLQLHRDWNGFFNYALENRNTNDFGLVDTIRSILGRADNSVMNGSHHQNFNPRGNNRGGPIWRRGGGNGRGLPWSGIYRGNASGYRGNAGGYRGRGGGRARCQPDY